MPELTGVETQKPNFSSTLVERLARREKERGEGRSSLKARLRRWVGTSTSSSRRLGPNIDREREMESKDLGSRKLESRELESSEMKASIDSGIGLDSSSSSCLLLPVKEEEEQQSWTTVQPTPILRSSSRAASLNSTKAKGSVKKSISFSDGHGKNARRRLRSHESQPSKQEASTAPQIIVSTWDSLGGGRQKAQHYSSIRAPEMKLWSIDHTSSWPRVRPPPEKVQVAGWWGPPSDSVSPQLGTIYNIVFAQVKEAAPDLSCLTMDLLFNPATNSLHIRIEALSASDFGRILSDLSILLFPTWPSLNLQSHAEGVLLHLLHLLLTPLFKDADEASGLALLTAACRRTNYKDIELCLAATRHLFLSFWKRLLQAP